MMNLYSTLMQTPRAVDSQQETNKCISETSNESCKVSDTTSTIDTEVKKVEAQKQDLLDRVNLAGQNPAQNSIPSYAGKTRTTNTQRVYVQRGLKLVDRYLTSIGGSHLSLPELNPIYFVKFLYSQKPKWGANTWKYYRQCALAVIPAMSYSFVLEAINYLNASKNPFANEIDKKNTNTKTQSSSVKSKHSNKRQKSINSVVKEVPKKLFADVIFRLIELKTNDARILINWLIAGISTGLRPVEWMSSELHRYEDSNSLGNQLVLLYVVNAKSTNARANGPTRVMDISDFHYTTINSIQAMVDEGEIWRSKGSFTDVHKRISMLLKEVIRYLRAKQGSDSILEFTLYSLRHQFVSNMRRVIRPAELSALLGHNSLKSGRIYYGKRGGGWKLKEIVEIPKPMANEVANVRIDRKHKQAAEMNSDFNYGLKLG